MIVVVMASFCWPRGHDRAAYSGVAPQTWKWICCHLISRTETL